jgi:oligopeptide transport system substrate-binding protein
MSQAGALEGRVYNLTKEKGMRKRSIIWAGLAAILAVIVVGSSAAAIGKLGHTSKAGVLRMSIGAEPPSLDAGLATDTTSSSILINLMDPLVKLGPGPALKAVPYAAASWDVKGATVTLQLRKDVKWWNGAPTTANDYVYSWLRTISPELGADYAYQFFGIKGAEAYNSCDPGKADCNALKGQVGIKALNKYTLQIQLTSPQPWFIQQLSHTSFLPVYKPAVDQYGSKFTEASNFVGNGPFKLASWKHDASVVLTKNTKWRLASTIKLNRIEMPIITDGTTAENAFDAGNIDVDTSGVVPQDIPKYKKTPYWKVWPALGTYYYGFNVKNISDVNQRRAMAFAIDRQAIIKYVAQAGQLPAKGFTPKGIAGGPTIDKDSTMPAIHQTAKAKSFMSKVANPKTDVNLFVNNAPGHIKIATAIQAFWKQIGINTSIKVLEWKQYLQFLGPPPNTDVDVYRLGWIYDFPDAYNGLVLWTCGSGNNNTNWCNKRYDSLVNQATKTPDFDQRAALYQKAESMLTGPNGDLPIMPIYWYTFTGLVKNNVSGFLTAPTGNWDLTKVAAS